MTNRELQECIIFQDSYYLIANKPPAVSAQDDHDKSASFHKLLEDFSRRQLYVVHRLDRPTSGVMVFTKKKRVAAQVSELMRNGSDGFSKKYVAAVQNPPAEPLGELTHYLLHDKKQRKSLVVEEGVKGAKKASLSYRTLGKIENYTLLEVELNTGRFHQIRAQLAAIGSPVKGDVKYGARRGNKDRSIHLHSWKLALPIESRVVNFVGAVPQDPVWKAFTSMEANLGLNKYE